MTSWGFRNSGAGAQITKIEPNQDSSGVLKQWLTSRSYSRMQVLQSSWAEAAQAMLLSPAASSE